MDGVSESEIDDRVVRRPELDHVWVKVLVDQLVDGRAVGGGHSDHPGCGSLAWDPGAVVPLGPGVGLCVSRRDGCGVEDGREVGAFKGGQVVDLVEDKGGEDAHSSRGKGGRGLHGRAQCVRRGDKNVRERGGGHKGPASSARGARSAAEGAREAGGDADKLSHNNRRGTAGLGTPLGESAGHMRNLERRLGVRRQDDALDPRPGVVDRVEDREEIPQRLSLSRLASQDHVSRRGAGGGGGG